MPKEFSSEDKYGNFVFCLSIDLIGSTQKGLELFTWQRNAFNRKFVEQIKPHLLALDLMKSLVKFTGDGWLIMESSKDVYNVVLTLCCLAQRMVFNFKKEMCKGSKFFADAIPSLRITIHSGLDIRVKLPDGRSDWVGDSARKAVRASAICYPNEILVGETVRQIVQREFHFDRVNIEERCGNNKPKKWEQDIEPLFTLGDFRKDGLEDDLEVPEYIIDTLAKIGKEKEAVEMHSQVSEHLENKAKNLDPNEIEARGDILKKWNRVMARAPSYKIACDTLKEIQDALAPDIYTYSILINKAPDYDEAKKWMKKMNVQPNVVTYSTLIKKAPDYNEAKNLLDMMRKEDIQPNVFAYNTLIDKAPNYDEAKKWMKKMNVQPDVITYNTLIKKAPDYNEAKNLLDMMRKEDIQPDVVTYSTLIKKAPDYNEAKNLLDMMRKEDIQPNVITYNALFSKDLSGLKAEDIPEAFHLALGYPHLQASKKLMREYPEEGLNYFRETLDSDPQHSNADYAIGVAFMELGREPEAVPHLKKALKLATADRRKKDIEERLSRISKKLHRNEHIEKKYEKIGYKQHTREI
jgi:tetratricopeptide (TPR) repeat protein